MCDIHTSVFLVLLYTYKDFMCLSINYVYLNVHEYKFVSTHPYINFIMSK